MSIIEQYTVTFFRDPTLVVDEKTMFINECTYIGKKRYFYSYSFKHL